MVGNYLLITPIKDEERNIELLKNTVLNQNVKPVLWVIVDSNSRDNSFELAEKIFKPYSWIYVIKQEQIFEKGYGHKNFSEAINEGFKFAKELSYKEKIKFEYIGKLDAAIRLQKNYFKILIEEMEKNADLVFTCGRFQTNLNNKRISYKKVNNNPLTGIHDMRLYRKDFFEDMGGYPLFYSPDTILLVKALNRSYKFKMIDKTCCEKIRLGGIGGSNLKLWKGYKLKGKGLYSLGYDIVYLLLNSTYLSIKYPPHYQGIAVIYGYFSSLINRDEKIMDKEIRDYFGNRLLKSLKSKIN